MRLLLILLLWGVCHAHPKSLFAETFDHGLGPWVVSSSEKFDGKWTVGRGTKSAADDSGLILQDAAKRHAISARFAHDLSGVRNDIVVQYEVRFHKPLQCGGAYIKLLASTTFSPESFNNETPYIIMFGPDHCGVETNKVHFIFRHQNPVSKLWEEKHLKETAKIKTDSLTHLYTLVIRQDNSFEIYIDQSSVRKGSLLEDFKPPVNPPENIDDPSDHKPEDWVDNAKMPDPSAAKPDDWDEDAPAKIADPKAKKPAGWLDDAPLQVPDISAEKPDDWDDESDGTWEPPMIDNPVCDAVGCGEWAPPKAPNPAFKGKWKAPMIDNPAYKGPWKARQIANPNYFVDLQPHNMAPMGGVGFELWTMTDQIEFDNVFVDTSEDAASEFAKLTWKPKFDAQTAEELLRNPPPSLLSDVLNWLERNWTVVAATAAVLVVSLVSSCVFCCRTPGGDDSAVRPVPVRTSTPERTSTSTSSNPATSTSTTIEPAETEETTQSEHSDEVAPPVGSSGRSGSRNSTPSRRVSRKPSGELPTRKTPDRAAKLKNRPKKAE